MLSYVGSFASRRFLSLATPAAPKTLLALQYVYDAENLDELISKRTPLRGLHLAHAAAARDAGILLLGGAFSDAPMGALLVFQGASKAEVEVFAKNDPYVKGRLVKSFAVREWTVVIERSPTSSPSS